MTWAITFSILSTENLESEGAMSSIPRLDAIEEDAFELETDAFAMAI